MTTAELLFGELAVSNRIVYLQSREIGWENINSISVKKGSLIIHLVDGNIINIPIRRIFNLEILIHLIKTEI